LSGFGDGLSRFGSPFDLSKVHWMLPEIVEVSYAEWTPGRLLRQFFISAKIGTNRQPMGAAARGARMRREREPLQNRVTPFGDVVAIPQRGLYIGNRGIIHDPVTKTLLGRRWTTKAWLVCVLDYKGRRRELMGGRSWTELFFLDEAVALAAGHRPCFFCRRADAQAFQAAWGKAKGGEAPLAPEIDAVLHEERLDRGRKRIHAISDPVTELPDGAVIVAAGEAYTIAHGRAFLWSEQGYQAARQIRRAYGLLTPPSTLLAMRAGYRPVLHPDIEENPDF
jgi:hypothetical protein